MQKRIELSKIIPNPDQPRKLFDPKLIGELAESIRVNGLMQPITVRPRGDGSYEIVAGERRYRAHCHLRDTGHDTTTILCMVRKMDEVQRDIEAIIENLQRADIQPAEEARAYKRMLDAGFDLPALAAKLGVPAFRISERVQLLRLAPTYLKMFETGQIDRQVAFELSRLEREADQTKIVQMVARGQLTGWKAVRTAVETILGGMTQADIFGDMAPAASDEDVATVNAMEAKIEKMLAMATAGFKDGECKVAQRVAPDRARLMADKIAALKKALTIMERDLRCAAAQAEIFSVAAE